MTKYLYGAAVQGIQGFIFQTNKLREIVGASELVEEICTTLFVEALHEAKGAPASPASLEKDENAILNAAGNIKYIFTDEEACRRLVREFPKRVMEFAPGITVSQSLVEFNDDFTEAVNRLELNLRAQRNRPMPELNIGLMGITRSRETGLPAVLDPQRAHPIMDEGTLRKLYTPDGTDRKDTTQQLCRKIFGDSVQSRQLAFDMKNLTGNNDWIAVIHADGNGLGQVVRKIGRAKDDLKNFSLRLNEATVAAAKKAYLEIGAPEIDGIYSLRPIVLGGDDLTVICRGDIAIPFTEAFLKFFEEETRNKLGPMLRKFNVFADRSDFLTACAGIAFVKSSYPFHFAYRLAEALCDRSKKDSKRHHRADAGNLPASCLSFHKVQDSFVSDLEDIAGRELRPQPDLSFEFGPFYLHPKSTPDGHWTIQKLREMAYVLDNKLGNAVKSHLRQWLTLLHDDPELAAQKLKRLKTITEMPKYVEEVTESQCRRENGVTYCPVYDILALLTINTQKTR